MSNPARINRNRTAALGGLAVIATLAIHAPLRAENPLNLAMAENVMRTVNHDCVGTAAAKALTIEQNIAACADSLNALDKLRDQYDMESADEVLVGHLDAYMRYRAGSGYRKLAGKPTPVACDLITGAFEEERGLDRSLVAEDLAKQIVEFGDLMAASAEACYREFPDLRN